ncbi:cytoplasmic tRNA 2-thiolation protein 2 isoform X2 [Hylobates moloch]|uniref:cytoplasmic tRNA 2-thiolation protein 2 isoform X2 n=1 Tax=Hylobates moloch TaxID=81572 RepID=UPI001363D6AB|nr:cytoplasmic tRNA 2-thiolation protein 2 isoform X2 [Hylobates moloch]
MCQVGEDYGEPAPGEPPPAPRPSREQKCVKCKEAQPVVVIRAGDAFCRDCFKTFYVHKFRAMLGKNRLIFPGEKVLLAWSGGPSSSSMVWQVLEGLSQDSAKRLRFVAGVIFVDEGAACGQSLEERSKTLAEVKPILQATGFPWHVVALEEVFSLPPSVLWCSAQEPVGSDGAYKAAVDSFLQQQHVLGAGGGPGLIQGEEQPPPPTQDPQSLARPPATAQTEALSQLFCSVRTLTAKEELLQTLRTHLILHMARAHGYSKVMTGDSCTRLAIKLMTNLALGRGAFLAWDTGFSDERHGDVVVVRPMRDHTLKEVAFYNRLFSVPSVFTPAVDTKAPEKASIHRLMEAFILRLQTQFPSTVSTVYRTSEKLVKAPRDGPAAGDSSPRCLLCMCALDVDAAGPFHALGVMGGGSQGVGVGAQQPQAPSAPGSLSSSLLADSATAFGAQTSSRLSQRQSPTPLTETRTPPGPCCSPGVGQAQGACRREDPQACVEEHLCYSCRVNMKDLPSLDPLPPYILAEAQLRTQRAWVLQEIRDCLIEDSDDEAGQS